MVIFKKIPEELDNFQGDLVLSVVGKDERPLKSTNSWIDWRLYGSVSELISRGMFKAELGERCMIPTYGKFSFDRVILLGGSDIFSENLLPETDDGQQLWSQIIRHVEQVVRSLRIEKVGLSLPRFDSSQQEKVLLQLVKKANLPTQTSLFLSRASAYATPLGL